MAAQGGLCRLVRGLVKVGVDYNAKTDYGETVLHYAAKGGDRATMRYVVTLINTPLTQHLGVTPCTIDTQNEGQETALHFAAALGHTTMVAMLLEHRADPTLQNEFLETALHRAIKSPIGERTGEIGKLLVDAKQGLLLKDFEGKTPAQLCHAKHWPRTLKRLADLGIGLDTQPRAITVRLATDKE